MSNPLPGGAHRFAITRSAAPVRTQVESLLRQAILTGHFHPGDRLIERELRELLGVSRTSLREALRRLEGRGLVVNITQKGLVVATMTPEEAEDIYQVRATIEGLAGQLFAERASNEYQAALQAALAAVDAAQRADAVPALVAAKDHFYAVLFAGAGNGALTAIAESLRDRTAWLRFRTLAHPGRASQSVAEMRRILEALLIRDRAGAAAACIEHVQAAAVISAQVLQQWQESA